MTTYTTRKLSRTTWTDFERLFSKGNGWDFCGCMLFHRGRHLPKATFPTRAEMGIRNRQEKRLLVEAGDAHGILVYAADEPVGWCQYGPREELSGIEASATLRTKYSEPADDHGHTALWRITCFVVDKNHRGRGVARLALDAALDAIRQGGGGLVEAFPRAAGRPSAAHGGYVSMFEAAGFQAVEPFGDEHTLMRRTV